MIDGGMRQGLRALGRHSPPIIRRTKAIDGRADFFPIVFLPFKILVLGTGMFFAIKWHHDQAKKENETKGP